MPGDGQGRVDKVERSGVYPASGPLPDGDAPLRSQAAWGQGERGAAGFQDHGESELMPPFGTSSPNMVRAVSTGTAWNAGTVVTQPTPMKMYRSEERLTVAVPMPGLEPSDIEVEITEDGRLDLRGQLRGLLKSDKSVVADEWNPGPYHREARLPVAVDGPDTNVTFNNGVLVVAMPVAEQNRPARLRMEKVGPPAQGWHVGNAGHPARPVSAMPEAPAARRGKKS